MLFFDDIIDINYFDLDNISLEEKKDENILIFNAAYKSPNGVKPLRTIFGKQMDILVNMIEINIYHHTLLKKSMTECLIELDLLIC